MLSGNILMPDRRSTGHPQLAGAEDCSNASLHECTSASVGTGTRNAPHGQSATFSGTDVRDCSAVRSVTFSFTTAAATGLVRRADQQTKIAYETALPLAEQTAD